MLFSLTGTGSFLTTEIYPPLDLQGEYVLGLVDLSTYNSIPNIEKDVNDKFYYGNKVITIDEGSYEIEDINHVIRGKLANEDGTVPGFQLRANNNTLKTEIKTNVQIDFSKPGTIGEILGFSKKVLRPRQIHISDKPVKIIKVDTIKVHVNLVRGTFDNGVEGHVIHEFFPLVEPGFKIVEIPRTIVYLPVNTSTLNSITVALRDQTGALLNLRGETLSVRLHLKRIS